MRYAPHILIIGGIAIFALLLGAEFVYAQGSFVPLAPAPGGSRLSNLYGSTSLADFINKLFFAAIAAGAILAVIRLAIAGYLYMTTDAWGTKGKAREIIGDVVVGLLLLLSIWLILRQINPQILNLDVLKNIPKTSSPQGQTQTQTQIQQSSPYIPPPESSVPGLSPFEQSQSSPYIAP